MTTYEKFKAGMFVCLGFLFFSVSVDIHHVVREWVTPPAKLVSTLADVTQTLDTLKGVGPQAVQTLKTLQDTTAAVGKQATQSLAVSDKVGKVLDKTADTLDNVNRVCNVAGKPCGTLADVNRTLSTVRGTFGQIEIAANHEDRNLSTLDVQEKQLYEDIHASTVDLNTLISSPDITRFLKSSADTSTQVAAIATDVHKEADKITAPQPWYKKIYTYGNTGVNVACLVTHSCPF